MSQREELFDRWAGDYEHCVQRASGFPFDGYDAVLDEAVRQARPQRGMTVLDLGTGTGNLARRFVDRGCALWGLDFSTKMLAQARAEVPGATFVKADLLGAWPSELDRRFDRIVSGYVLHEFDLSTKIDLLDRLLGNHLHAGCCIVIADIAFPSAACHDDMRRKCGDAWDESEHYWKADESREACAKIGLALAFTRVSSCAGVFVFRPAKEL